MYNRYVPQSDGSYCRTRIPDSPPRQAAVSQPRKNIPISREAEEPSTPNMKPVPHPCPKPTGCTKNSQRNHPPQNTACGSSVSGFLKQLLPKNFEAADLIVVLLLLLISADNAEDQNNALLTLALYLFM